MNSLRETLLGLQTRSQSKPLTILTQLRRSNMLRMMPRRHYMRCSLAPMILRRHLHKMRVTHKVSNKPRIHRRNNNNKRCRQLKLPSLGLQLLNLMKMETLLRSHKLSLPQLLQLQLSQLKLTSRLLQLKSLRLLMLQDTFLLLSKRRTSPSPNQSNPSLILLSRLLCQWTLETC